MVNAVRGNSIKQVPQAPSASQSSLGSLVGELETLVKDLFQDPSSLLGGLAGATGPAPTSTMTPHLTYYGGAVLDKPVLHGIYVGDYWSSAQGQKDVTHNDAFMKDIGNSSLPTTWMEYGAGRSTFGGSALVGGGSPTVITDAQAQQIVKDAIASGKVTKDAQGIYQVILPPGCVADTGQKDPSTGTPYDSKHGVGGWHQSFDDGHGNPVYYDVIAYSDTSGNGINFDGNPEDNITITQSHEISEAVTDPDVNSPIPGRGLAWYDFDTVPVLNGQWGENGDIGIMQAELSGGLFGDLSGAYQMVDGFAMQNEWSNKDGVSEVAGSTTSPQPLPPASPLPAGV